MSVIALDFYAPDDPNGTLLGTLDEADCKAIEFRVALTELGAGKFTVSRHNASATSTLIREDNLVKVRIPSVSADPIFAFWLKEGDFTLISTQEQGGEDLTFGGPGVLHILSRARLHWAVYAPGQPNRGDAPDVPFMWRWRGEPYGAMLVRGVEEGQNEPGAPLADVTIDFNRFEDSDGTNWPVFGPDFEFQTPIGTDVLTLAERVATGGDLFLIGHPGLSVQAFQSYGRNLTGSFASDNVRFQKGINILTELKREIAARDMLTHLIVQDSDSDYGIHTWAGYSAGDRATYGFLEVGQTNDPDQIDKIAAATMAASRTSGESLALEITPGFDPVNGRYMPGPEGTNGHFWIGDQVTVHTGTGEHDFNAAPQNVVAIRVVLHEAAVDDTDDTSARSLHVVPELNYLSIRGFSSNSPSAIGQPGFCCGPSGPIQPEGSVCTRFYLTDGAAVTIAQDAGWDGEAGVFDNAHELSTTADSTLNGLASWAVVNAAAGDYGINQYQRVMNAAEAAAIAAGASFHLQMRAKSRHGLGISESSQDNYLTAGARVHRPGTGIIGTALAVGSANGGTKFPASSTVTNRMLSTSLAAVPGAVAGDILVVEIGTHHVGPISGGTGVGLFRTDTADTDLPTGDGETAALNSWIDICTGSATGGSTVLTTVRQGQASYTTVNQYVPVGSTIEMGLLSDDGLHYLNAADVEVTDAEDQFTNNDVEAVLGEIGNQVDDIDERVADLETGLTSGTVVSHTEVVGDASATSFDVTHGLGTNEVLVQVWDLSGSLPELVSVNLSALDSDTVRIDTDPTVPGSSSLRVVIHGTPGASGGGGGGGGAFAPDDFSDLGLWLDADDLSTFSFGTGTAVATWADKSGAGRNMTQATGANQPTLVAGVVNGRPVVRFDGSNDRLELASGNLDLTRNISGASVFVVNQVDNTTAEKTLFWSSITGSNSSRAMIQKTTSAEYLIGGRRLDGDSFDSMATPTTYSAGVVTIDQADYDWADSALYLYVDGTLDDSDTGWVTSGVTSDTNSQFIAIGRGSVSGNPAQFLDGDVCEVLVYRRVLTTAERAEVVAYLTDKWLGGNDINVQYAWVGGIEDE